MICSALARSALVPPVQRLITCQNGIIPTTEPLRMLGSSPVPGGIGYGYLVGVSRRPTGTPATPLPQSLPDEGYVLLSSAIAPVYA